MKKMLAMLLAALMLVSMMPITALAAAPAKLVMCHIDSEDYCTEWTAFGSYTEHFYPALLVGNELQPIDPAAL